jgi:hypothetical protein
MNKIVWAFALVSCSVLLLVACAAGSQAKTFRRSDQDVARLMAINDNVIVPGERVGSVFLGMTEEQLYRKMGNPDQNYPQDSGASMLYIYPDLEIYAQMATHQVSSIIVRGPSYHTIQGVSAGTPELEMKAKIGQPVWEILAHSAGTELKLCYNSGLTAYAYDGHITRMQIWSGMCGG